MVPRLAQSMLGPDQVHVCLSPWTSKQIVADHWAQLRKESEEAHALVYHESETNLVHPDEGRSRDASADDMGTGLNYWPGQEAH